MCVKGKPCAAGWAPQLPDNCPPEKAQDPTGQILYRFLDKADVRADDFRSHRELGRHTGGAPECVARAVSVYSNLTFCRKFHRLATHRKKKLARITLTIGQGVLSPPDSTSHISWWRCGALDPLPMAAMVNEHDNA